MASMGDIKRRIKSVSSTQQITKAMNLVASSKLTRAKSRFLDTKPYFNGVQQVIANIAKGAKGVTSDFITNREVKNTAIAVISGDRGLCGGYNANVSKLAYNLGEGKNAKYITLGSKAQEFFTSRGCNIVKSYRGISEDPQYYMARVIGERLIEMYTKGEADEIYIAYTEYISTIANEPKYVKILPLDINDFQGSEKEENNMTLTIYEPSEEEVLDYIIPKYVSMFIYGAMVEASVCELGSRMTAMDSATENAGEMIDKLSLAYNRARQGAITQEITEIVSGSNALE